MQRVICNAGCQEEFGLIEMGTVRIRDDIEAVGFTCPHCGHFYGHYQNNTVKRLQREQRKLLSRGKNAKGKILKRILLQIEEKKAEIKAEMDRLRREVEGESYAEN